MAFLNLLDILICLFCDLIHPSLLVLYDLLLLISEMADRALEFIYDVFVVLLVLVFGLFDHL